MEPKLWSQSQLQPWLPRICPLTLIGLWLDPAINSSKRDNADAFFVFHWTTSCVALSHVFLASHSHSSWQVPLFNFYLPALQSSCLCVGLCWKTETRLGALVLAFPLAFHPSFPLSQSSVVWAACVSWTFLWSCSFSQMLQEHPLVKGIEQGTVKEEKYPFSRAWNLRKSPQGVRMEECVFSLWFLAALQPQDTCVNERKRQHQRSVLWGCHFDGFKDISHPLLSLKVWGQQGQAATTLSPQAQLSLQTGRAAPCLGKDGLSKGSWRRLLKGLLLFFSP